MAQDNRKTFTFYNPLTNKECYVRAAGIMLYKVEKSGNIKVLIQNRIKYYEDLGGKTSGEDLSLYDTAIRELREETNGIINVSKRRLENAPYHYNPKGKYILFLVRAVGLENLCESSLFDFYENSSKKFRMIIWENLYDLLDFPTHPRLIVEEIIQLLTFILKNSKY